MTFERGIFAAGQAILRNTVPYAALAVVGEYAIQVIKETTDIDAGMTVASIVVWSFLAYAAHAEVLLPSDRDKSKDAQRTIGFALRTFGLLVIVLVPVFVVAGYIRTVLPSDSANDRTLYVLVALVSPVIGILWLVVFGLLGTILPAYVADRHRGLGAAFSRGRRQFFWIVGRLLAMPGLVLLASLIVAGAPLLVFDSDGDFLGEGYVPDPVASVPALVAYAIQTYAVVLTAVVLSRGFLRDEDRPA